MQSVIVTYPDGAVNLQRARIPVPPSQKLTKAFQSNTVLYLHATTGATTLSSTLGVTGATTLSSTLSVTNTVNMNTVGTRTVP